MKIKMAQQRWWIIGIAMGLTLLAVYLVQVPEEQAMVESMPSRAGTEDIGQKGKALASPVRNTEEDESLLPDLTQKHLFVGDKTKKSQDLFKGHAWYVPPPPPKPVAVKVVSPPPAAPALPFIYIGKLDQGPQDTQIFLLANNKVLSVLVGKNADPVWRLDKEDANALTFTYLPLRVVKMLSKGMPNPEVNKPKNENNPDATN